MNEFSIINTFCLLNIYFFFTFSLLIISCITKNMLSFLFLYTFIPIGGNHLWCMVDINFRFGIFFFFFHFYLSQVIVSFPRLVLHLLVYDIMVRQGCGVFFFLFLLFFSFLLQSFFVYGLFNFSICSFFFFCSLLPFSGTCYHPPIGSTSS